MDWKESTLRRVTIAIQSVSAPGLRGIDGIQIESLDSTQRASNYACHVVQFLIGCRFFVSV